MNCGVGHRHGLDPMLLGLWRRPVATALIQHLAWKPPYTTVAALEKAKSQKKKKKKQKTRGTLEPLRVLGEGLAGLALPHSSCGRAMSSHSRRRLAGNI